MSKSRPSSRSSTRSLIEHLKYIVDQSKANNDRQFVTALGRGLLMLTAFEHSEQLSHQQLCQMTDLPKATITRLIHTLITLGFLRVTDQGLYQLGSSAVRLSATAWSRHDIISSAEPLLRQFASEHKVSVNLATEVDGEMRYLACCRSPARLSVNLQVGSAVPIAQTAIGRAFYASSTESRQSTIQINLQNQLSPKEYKHALKALNKASMQFADQAYTLSDGEFTEDILAVAVPVLDVTTGHYDYSLNASVPRANWNAGDYASKIVPRLQALADKIGS